MDSLDTNISAINTINDLFVKDIQRPIEGVIKAVSYTHLTLPTNREV